MLEQSYKTIEYIIIDGNSKDNTIDIVQSFGSKIYQFISEPDSGIYDAMNKGIKHATGDLIIFINAGDYYVSPNVLSDAITKMNFKNADLFFGRFIWHDTLTHDKTISDHSATKYHWDLENSNFPHPATFYKRKVFSKTGLFNESYKILGDYEWNARALIKYKIVFQYIDVITAYFSADGISNTDKNGRLLETNRIKDEYFQPQWLYHFMSRYNIKKYAIDLRKTMSLLFHKKFKRVY